MPLMRRVSLFAIVAVVLGGAASWSTVRAEDFATDVPDLVWIDVGWAFNDVSTDVALRGPNGIGATVNFEDVFDLPGDKATARMLGSARISEKRRYIDFGYVDIRRSGSRILQNDVTFGDYTFQAGGEVEARFNTRFAYAAFRYDFLHEEKARISGSAGLTYLQLKTSVDGDANFVLDPNGDPVTTDFSKEVSQGAPVPMVGLSLDWALTRRLVVHMYSRFFRVHVSAFNGGLFENGARLDYYFAKHFGLGLGFDRTSLAIKELKVGEGNIVKADYAIGGLGLYATLAF